MLFLMFPLQCLSIICSTGIFSNTGKRICQVLTRRRTIIFYNYIFKILLILSDIHNFENKYRDSNEIKSLCRDLLIESDEIIKKSNYRGFQKGDSVIFFFVNKYYLRKRIILFNRYYLIFLFSFEPIILCHYDHLIKNFPIFLIKFKYLL